MRIDDLNSKSSPIWSMLYLSLVYLVFMWNHYQKEENWDYQSMYRQSQKLLQTKHYQEALGVTLDLVKKFPTHPLYLRQLITIYHATNDRPNLENALSQYIKTQPPMAVEEICAKDIPNGDVELFDLCQDIEKIYLREKNGRDR